MGYREAMMNFNDDFDVMSALMEVQKVGVHASHCCKLHGCKYNNSSCPVKLGEVKQEHACPACPSIEELNDLKHKLTELQKEMHWLEDQDIKIPKYSDKY